MQVRAVFIGFVKEIAHANRPFEREGGIERTPGKRKRAGTAGFRFIAASGMANAGKFALEGTPVGPLFRVGDEAQVCRRFEEEGGHIFVGQHWFSPRRPL